MTFRFCPACAAKLARAPHGGRVRPFCRQCGYIQYRNPTVGVAVVLLEGDRILMGRRSATNSYAGHWCIPCGHVEWDEDVRLAARREFAEETGLEVTLGDVVAVHSNFHNARQHTVGVWFTGQVSGGLLQAGDDLDRVDFFPLHSPPAPLAFATDGEVLAQLQAEIG